MVSTDISGIETAFYHRVKWSIIVRQYSSFGKIFQTVEEIKENAARELEAIFQSTLKNPTTLNRIIWVVESDQ